MRRLKPHKLNTLTTIQSYLMIAGTVLGTIIFVVIPLCWVLRFCLFNYKGYGTMRQVADRLYRAIIEANITPDKENMTGTNDNIGQGYWMIADVTDLDGNEANSLVMVDTKGQDALTITPKTALPTVEKKVKDIDDSEDDNILDNAWHDTADHDIGDTVPFKLTGTLPSNAAHYTSFTMVFHDTLSDGLSFDNSSVKVFMYDTKYKADVDTDLNDGKDVTDKFSVTTSVTDDCTFEVGCDNVFAIEGVTKDTAFVVYYEAELNENAVIGATGNPNDVYLEFSNNPYGEGTGNTEKDEVVVYTYQLVINKTDSHGHALKGAGFTLYKKNLAGVYNAVSSELKGDDMTTFTWSGLDDGDYKLVETTTPAGYNTLADLEFVINATHKDIWLADGNYALEDVIAKDPSGTTVVFADKNAEGLLDGKLEGNVENFKGVVLPETGAEGTFFLIAGGALLVMVAAVFMITRKKMSVYED